MIVLDTEHISLLQSGGSSARKIESRLDQLGFGDSFPTTIISYEEQMRGWMARLAGTKSVSEEVLIYEKLGAMLEFFATIRIFQFTASAATEFQRLRRLGIGLGPWI